MKKILWLIILVVIVAIVYLVIKKKVNAPAISDQLGRASYVWRFNQKPEQYGMPQTEVVLVVNNTEHIIGTFEGSCQEVPKGKTGILSEPADQNEVSRIQCWSGGGGNEVGVFQEGEDFVVKSGELSEGTSEEPAFRGNFIPVLAL
ncbi:MAG TPA: hypothetical protein VGE63_02480 [Candidatus Paceibacterota bacterium]